MAGRLTSPPPLFDRRFWQLNAAVWTLLATTNSGAVVADMVRSGQEVPWWRIFAYYLAVYFPWFLTTPIAFWWTLHFPPVVEGRPRHVVRNLFFMIVWICLYIPIQGLIASIAQHGTASMLIATVNKMPLNQWVLDSIYLLALGGIAVSTHQARAARHREQESARLTVENAELSTRLAEARLQMLQAQLEPHFLYNALNSIASLIRHRNPETAAEAVGLLSELLRYATRATTLDWVTLSEELDFAEAYWGFQQLRYGERLSCRYEIDPSTSMCRMPPLILQPLLENAVRHGVETLEGAGRVALTTQRHGAQLEITVHNSPGSSQGATGGLGVGLRNTRERLRWMFSDPTDLQLQTSSGGFTAKLTLPALKGDSPEETRSEDSP